MVVSQTLNQTNLFDFLMQEDTITWQTVLMEAVKEGNLDPWDIDISALAEQFLKVLHDLKQMNFTLSGKIVLAAAIMLRLKSKRFLSDDIAHLDRVIADSQTEEVYGDDDDTDYDELSAEHITLAPPSNEPLVLYPRTPQPRRRKVSIYDLVGALDKALEVKNRRKSLFAKPAPAVERPTNVVDIGKLIDDVYAKVDAHYRDAQQTLSFSHLVGSSSRDAKVNTFVPLLHLSNARKVKLDQKEHFADFLIELHQPTQPNNS